MIRQLEANGYEYLNLTQEVQQEIVTLLDKFHALVNNISSGLPAEIAARRKQYEHYRNRLLNFEKPTTVIASIHPPSL